MQCHLSLNWEGQCNRLHFNSTINEYILKMILSGDKLSVYRVGTRLGITKFILLHFYTATIEFILLLVIR